MGGVGEREGGREGENNLTDNRTCSLYCHLQGSRLDFKVDSNQIQIISFLVK